MERLIELIGDYSDVMSPAVAIWSISLLYLQPKDADRQVSQLLFFGSMLLIAGLTVRTTMMNPERWLIHAASLGCLIVSGVMRRPSATESILSGY